MLNMFYRYVTFMFMSISLIILTFEIFIKCTDVKMETSVFHYLMGLAIWLLMIGLIKFLNENNIINKLGVYIFAIIFGFILFLFHYLRFPGSTVDLYYFKSHAIFTTFGFMVVLYYSNRTCMVLIDLIAGIYVVMWILTGIMIYFDVSFDCIKNGIIYFLYVSSLWCLATALMIHDCIQNIIYLSEYRLINF